MLLGHRVRRALSVPRSFSFVAAGGGTTSTITIPTFAVGDLCVVWNWYRNAYSSGGVPSGFTGLQDNQVSGGGIISAKILVGGETTVTGLAGSAEQRWIAATFRPTVAISGFAWNDPAGASADTNPAVQTINAAGATPPVILLGQMAAGSAVSPRTMSPALDELNNHAQTNHFAHYKIYNPGDTPADHTYDMDDEGNQNLLQSGYLTFT